jgi:hypothetical protein
MARRVSCTTTPRRLMASSPATSRETCAWLMTAGGNSGCHYRQPTKPRL